MKTATSRHHLPSDNLWQWAEESRRIARGLPASPSRSASRNVSRMSKGILARLVILLRELRG